MASPNECGHLEEHREVIHENSIPLVLISDPISLTYSLDPTSSNIIQPVLRYFHAVNHEPLKT